MKWIKKMKMKKKWLEIQFKLNELNQIDQTPK